MPGRQYVLEVIVSPISFPAWSIYVFATPPWRSWRFYAATPRIPAARHVKLLPS